MNNSMKLLSAAAAAGLAAYALRALARGAPRPEEQDRIGYPPFDTLKTVGDDIWIVDSGPIKAVGLSVPVRMTVMRLSTGELLLHSPTRLTDGLVAELNELGPVRYLVAPTTAHWTFLPGWQRDFPQAEVWAVPGLRERPQVRSSGLRIDHDLGDEAPEVWATDVEQGLVRGGAGFTEAYILHRKTRTLVLSDLIQNLETNKLPPLTRGLASVVRANTGRTAAHVRLVTALGGAEAKEQIEHLLSLRPGRVTFAHGAWFDTNASERLRAGVRLALLTTPSHTDLHGAAPAYAAAQARWVPYRLP